MSVPPPFLSMDNLNTLGSIIENFIYDTYQINLTRVFPYEEFRQLLRNVMNNIDASNKTATISEKNKLVIVNIRNFIFEKLKKHEETTVYSAVPEQVSMSSPPVPAVPPSPLQPLTSPSLTPLPAQLSSLSEMPTQQMDRDDNEDMEDKNKKDEIFFKRLQELEQRRKIPATPQQQQQSQQQHTQQQQTQQQQTSIVSNEVLHIFPSAPPASSQQVIVAVSPPPRHGISHIISSWDRTIQEYPDRTSFVWNNPLPTMIDPLGTRVAALFLPVSVCNYTPYVTLHIQGASGMHTSCILAPENYIVNRTRGWIRWSPMDDSLSYIKNVSSPWTIQLRSADNTILPLGRDTLQIVSINIDITNKSAKLTVSPLPQEGEFLVGDQIWIYTKTERKKTEVLSVSNDTIEVRYQIPLKSPTMSTSAHEWIRGYILNYNRQWSMILDLTSSEHRKTL